MKRSTLALTFLALLTTFAFQSASAATVADIDLMIDALKFDTQATEFFGQNAAKDEAGLLGKLTNAKTKLSQGKFADAIQKVQEYRDKVFTLSSSGKIDSLAAPGLIQQANEIISALQQLG